MGKKDCDMSSPENNVKMKINEKKTKAKALPVHIQKIQTSSGNSQFHCTVCDKYFKSRTQKYYHYGCANKDEKKFKCNICNKLFSSRSHWSYHIESHANQLYPCTECNKTFKNPTVLAKHSKLHTTKCVKCPECSKILRSKEILKIHLEQHKNNPRFECNDCGTKYVTKSTLKLHMLTHYVKKFICSHCGKRFQRNSILKSHLRKHLNVDSFVCTLCRKDFSDRGALLRHKNIHNRDIKYVCKFCDTHTVRRDNMLRHIRNAHNGLSFETCVNVINSYIPNDSTYDSRTEEDNNGNSSSKTSTIPKTVPNSSVIKCIGNVKPIEVPISLPVEDESISTNKLIPETSVREESAATSLVAVQSSMETISIAVVEDKERIPNTLETVEEPYSLETFQHSETPITLTTLKNVVQPYSMSVYNSSESSNLLVNDNNQATTSTLEFVQKTNTVTILENVVLQPSVLPSTSKKPKKKKSKKYDPIQMYRKILIPSDDDDDDEDIDRIAQQNVNLSTASANEISTPEISQQQQQESRMSRFAATHWRKNFKYTYEYQDF